MRPSPGVLGHLDPYPPVIMHLLIEEWGRGLNK